MADVLRVRWWQRERTKSGFPCVVHGIVLPWSVCTVVGNVRNTIEAWPTFGVGFGGMVRAVQGVEAAAFKPQNKSPCN